MKTTLTTSTIIFCLMCTVYLACTSDDRAISIDQNVNLKSPQIGQRSLYVLITGACGLDNTYQYSGDTLELSIVGDNKDLFLQEQFTESSPLYETRPFPIKYPIHHMEDRVILPERDSSTLFFFYGSDTILTSPTAEFTLRQESCRLMNNEQIFTGDAVAQFERFSIMDQVLNNQFVVSCVPVIIELEAYLAYRDGWLNMSYTLDSGFPAESVRGWIRLP